MPDRPPSPRRRPRAARRLVVTLVVTFLTWAPTATAVARVAPAERAEPPAAAPAPHPAVAALESVRRTLEPTEDGLRGDGADWLAERSAEALHVVVGESHYIEEVPPVVALLAAAEPFDVFVVETGPLTGELLDTLPRAELDALVAEHPEAVPFYDVAPELDLLYALRADGARVWGIDQEFVRSPRLHLAELVRRAPDEAARVVAAEYLERARAAYAAGAEAEQPLLLTLEPSDFERLRSAFASAPEALARIDALAESNRVYRLFVEREIYRSNFERIALMKRYFWERYRPVPRDEPPRLLFKFGSTHGARGYTPLHMLDVGSLAHELAVAHGRRSFHVQVAAARYRGADGTLSDAAEQMPVFGHLARACPEETWCVFDLEALRPQAFRGERSELPAELRDLAWHYDALVLAPVAHSTRGARR